MTSESKVQKALSVLIGNSSLLTHGDYDLAVMNEHRYKLQCKAHDVAAKVVQDYIENKD